MIRALAGWLLSFAALKLAELARHLLQPPGQAGHTSVVGANARGGSALLGFVLSNGPVFYDGRHFAKMGDPTWRQ